MKQAQPGKHYKWLALATGATSTSMGTLATSTVNISLPRLTEVFKTGPSIVPGVTVTCLLAGAGLVLTVGRLRVGSPAAASPAGRPQP